MFTFQKPALFLLGTLLALSTLSAAEPSEAPGLKVKLGLADYLRMVVQENETIQSQLLATEAARQRSLAEYGTYEPEFVASAQRNRNRRPNTVEQQRNLSGVPILDERNDLFDAGVEAFTPTGAKVRLGYTLNNFNNNLRPLTATGVDPTTGRTDEWQSFAGLSVTQPLLKNGGMTAALANLRIAAINSESAFQEYRRQLMVTLSQAESAYWGVYFAQEQLRFLDESVSVAESLLSDSREKVKAGKGTDLDVLEAEAGLALRRTKRNEALQKFNEAMGQLLVFAGKSPRDSSVAFLAADDPESAALKPSYAESWTNAVTLNPDYLIQKTKLNEALVRLGLAQNQRLPELNLKGSYGLNGLGQSPSESFDEVSGGGFPSWSIGLEMRIPLGGGIRGDHEYAAMLATVKQVKMQMQGMETQLANALNTSIKKLKTNRASTDDYRTMIHFNEDLLKTERDRLAFGKVEGRRVLEVEAGLFEVKQGLADALVQTRRAALELYLAEGSILKRRGLEFTPAQLRDQTLALLHWDRKKGKVVKKPAPKVRFAPTRLGLREGEAPPRRRALGRLSIEKRRMGASPPRTVKTASANVGRLFKPSAGWAQAAGWRCRFPQTYSITSVPSLQRRLAKPSHVGGSPVQLLKVCFDSSVAAAAQQLLAFPQSRLRRILKNVTSKIRELVFTPDRVLEGFIHPQRAFRAAESVDFPSTVPLPTVQKLREFPLCKRSSE